jgi:hypothetical protein
MPGEVELDIRREDPYLPASGVVDEDGLAEAQVGSDPLAALGRDLGTVEEDTQRVAARAVGAAEDAEKM